MGRWEALSEDVTIVEKGFECECCGAEVSTWHYSDTEDGSIIKACKTCRDILKEYLDKKYGDYHDLIGGE